MTTTIETFTQWDSVPAGLRTRTGWKENGRNVKSGEEPVAQIESRYRSRCNVYALFNESQTKPTKVLNYKEPVEIDLLAAIFTVTRSAKRYRDAAESCYHLGNYKFASVNSRKKKWLYTLKDWGILAAARAGRIQATEKHGCLTVWRGEGYCFHSLLFPDGVQLPETKEQITVEAKPKGSKEPRLMDAEETLRDLSCDLDGFSKGSFPAREHAAHVPRDWDDCDDDREDDY